jgi:hypothetical protein
MTHAGAIGAIHPAADLRADRRADHRPDDHGDQPIVVIGDVRADHTAGDAAQHRTDLGTVAATEAHAVIALPVAPAVPSVSRVVFLPPAMCRGVRRGDRQRGARQRQGRGKQQVAQCRRNVHTLLLGSVHHGSGTTR